ncbi:MAG TPA: DNA polymerase III subunit gamma/tau [Clostridiaceae bacterium]|nr:DNA polymerase III subunit gamma/tau [Clostridiaceae bacterium]
MAHMALYRKWRPMTFDEVVEQRHIVTTLKNSIKNNSVSHAYLFCGTRGTGKTTMAKIFARAINCLEPVDGNPCNKCVCCTGILDGSIIDVIEIDAASNNGVDDVREIRDAVMYVPAVTRYKVYIIDEVHMLSAGAFNALLKTLEEPPENVVFILATTEPQKLPATILSRCQRFDFKRITMSGLEGRIRTIAESCGVSVEKSALQLIARLSGGGMRDAISLLDQCIAQGKPEITYHDVAEISGLSAYEAVNSFARAVIDKNTPAALKAIKEIMDQGRDLKPFCSQLIEWFRNLMLIKTGGEALSLVSFSEEELKPVREAEGLLSLDDTLAIIRELSETENSLKWADDQRMVMEIAAVRLCTYGAAGSGSNAMADLEARVRFLERKLMQITDMGISSASPAVSPPQTEKKPPVSVKTSEKKAVPAEKTADPGIPEDSELKQWPDVIEELRSMKKMKVYAYLLDTKCFLSPDGTANVVIPEDDALKKTVLSRSESIEAIKEAIRNVLGTPMNIRVIDEKKLSTLSGGNPGNSDEDPLLEKLMQIARENNIPLKVEE